MIGELGLFHPYKWSYGPLLINDKGPTLYSHERGDVLYMPSPPKKRWQIRKMMGGRFGRVKRHNNEVLIIIQNPYRIHGTGIHLPTFG